MKQSEELMLLLELNGYDVKKFKLKKQLEYEQTGNLNLYKHKKFADLLLSHYSYVEDHDYFHKNPLTYNKYWSEDVTSLDQFYVSHPDLSHEMTLQEFLLIDSFNSINRESILYDIFDGWVEEYREASTVQMENLKDMVELLPKKSKKYHKPRKIPFLVMVLLSLVLILLYKNPTVLQPKIIPFIANFTTDLNLLLFDSAWFSFYGNVVIFFMVLYAVLSNAFSMFIRDVRSEKNKHALQTFIKWNNDMKEQRLKQSGELEDYVDRVIKDPNNSKLDMAKLSGPEILLKKFKDYVNMVERKFDFMTINYSRIMRYLRLLFVLGFLLNISFYLLGFLMITGVI